MTSNTILQVVEWLETNPNPIVEKDRTADYRAYYEKNKPLRHELSRLAMARRRVRKLGIKGGNHTREEWDLLKSKYEFSCLSCGEKEPEIKLAADHITPIVKGGNNTIENIQPLCRSCNSRKGTKIIDYRPVQNPHLPLRDKGIR